MRWDIGYSASYYLTIVDPKTWVDTSRIEITGGTIQRNDSDLLESADIDCGDVIDEITTELWVRVWLDTDQNGDYSHTALFTGLATSPDRNINGRRVTTSLQCYSVLKPAQDILLLHGWYAPVDVDGGMLIKRLLSVCGVPIIIDGESKRLSDPIIAEQGESNLTMAWKIADAIGWAISIDGYGRIYLGPYSTTSKCRFGIHALDILEQSVTVKQDWYNCPNVFIASANGYSAMVRDDNYDSDLSTVNRGREVWAEETDCDLAEGEDLTQYAYDRLKELQQVSRTASYTRRFYPEISIFDVITLDYPEQNLVGNCMITSQNITLGYNAKVSEEVTFL